MRWIFINALLLASCINIPERDFTLRPSDSLPTDSTVDGAIDSGRDIKPPDVRDMDLDVRDMGIDVTPDAQPRDMGPPIPDALLPEPTCLGHLEGTWSAYFLLSNPEDDPKSLISADFVLQISAKGSVSSHLQPFGEIDLLGSCPSAPDAGISPDVGASPDTGPSDVGLLLDIASQPDAQPSSADVHPPERAPADSLPQSQVEGVPGFADTWIVTPPKLGIPITFVFDAASGLGFFYATADPIFGILARRSERNIASSLRYLGLTTQKSHTQGLIQSGDGSWNECEDGENPCFDMSYRRANQNVRLTRAPPAPESRSYDCTPTQLGAACGIRMGPGGGVDQAIGIAFMMNSDPELERLPQNIRYRCAGIRSVDHQPQVFEETLILRGGTLHSRLGTARFEQFGAGFAKFDGDAGLFDGLDLSIATIRGNSMLMISTQASANEGPTDAGLEDAAPTDAGLASPPWAMAICRVNND